MRLDYDLTADALYITLLDDESAAATVPVEDLTLVDLTEDGRVIGIEVIGIKRLWALDQILERFPISDEDEAELRAVFPVGAGAKRSAPRTEVRASEQVLAIA